MKFARFVVGFVFVLGTGTRGGGIRDRAGVIGQHKNEQKIKYSFGEEIAALAGNVEALAANFSN